MFVYVPSIRGMNIVALCLKIMKTADCRFRSEITDSCDSICPHRHLLSTSICTIYIFSDSFINYTFIHTIFDDQKKKKQSQCHQCTRLFMYYKKKNKHFIFIYSIIYMYLHSFIKGIMILFNDK